MFSTPFERLNLENQNKIRVAVETTATAVSPGGVVLGALQEMLKSLKTIESHAGKGGGSVLSFLIGKKTLLGIGETFKLIVEAINSISGNSKEAKEKVEAIVMGVNSVVNMGSKLLKFSTTLALATPLLMLAMPFAPLFAGAMRVIVNTLAWASKPLTDPAVLKALDSLGDIGKSILIFGGFMALSLPVYILALPAALLVSATIGLIGLAFYALNKLGIFKNMEEASKGLKSAGISILVLGLSLAATYLVFKLIGGNNFYKVTFQMLGVVLLVGATFALVGIFAPLIKKAAIALSLSALSLIAITTGLLFFRMVIPPNKEGWTILSQVGAALLGIGGLMALAGTVAPFIALGAVAFLLAGVSLVVLGLGIFSISKIFKGDGIKNMLAPSGQKTRGFLGIGGGREMSNLEYLLSSIANAFTISPFKIAAMLIAIPAMIGASFALITISTGIKKIQNLKIDPVQTSLKIEKIATVLADTFGRIGKKYPGGRKSLFNRVFGGGEQSLVADGIDAVMGMGRAMSSIAKGLKSMASLKIPIYEGTQIKSYVTLSNNDIISAGKNTTAIVEVLGNTFGELGKKYPGGRKSLFNRVFGGGKQSAVADGISSVTGMGTFLYQLASGIKMMAELKYPIYGKDGEITGYQDLRDPSVFKKVTTGISYIITSLTNVFGEIGSSPEAKRPYWFGKSKIERGIKLIKKTAEPINEIAEIIQIYSNKEIDGNIASQKIKNFLASISNIFSSTQKNINISEIVINKIENLGDSLKKMGSNIQVWNRFVDGFDKYVKNFSIFKNEVNSFDLEKLKLVSELFTGLSKFDKKAIDALGIKLAEAIEKLKNELKKGIEVSLTGGGVNSTLEKPAVTTTVETALKNLPIKIDGISELITTVIDLKNRLSGTSNPDMLQLVQQTGLDRLDDVLSDLNKVLVKIEQKL